MRTSFKHHQLKTMKTYFNLNHNPDAKDLKQLAQKTGLTKRVLQVSARPRPGQPAQVWFQNARAKYRRSQQVREGAEAAQFGALFGFGPLGPASPRSCGSLSPEAQSDDSSTRPLPAEHL